MENYIALLRGINVGGNKKIKMTDLRALLTPIGLENLVTYIQSGNLVFNHKKTNEIKLATLIQQKIKENYGFDVHVIVKSQKEFDAILSGNPFLKENEDINQKMLHVTSLDAIPSKENLKTIDRNKYLPDRYEVVDKHIYLYFPNGYGRTKLTNTLFEKKLKLKATTRNWRTMNKLGELLQNL